MEGNLSLFLLMIEQMFFWLLLLFSLFYILLTALLWRGLSRLHVPVSNTLKKKISVIIAARNEEKNILPLLSSLANQRYPKENFEIIVVNDRSTDGTAALVEQFRQQCGNLRMISIESNQTDMPNKKNALRAGIDAAQFDILAFTDADCIVPPAWLEEISRHYSEETGVVAGYSPYRYDKTFSVLRYEEFRKSILAAASVGLRNAFLCTGRNFSYRKAVFKQLGGFEKIKQSISGDDDLFLQRVSGETDWQIAYMTGPDSSVTTLPPDSFSTFLHQRIRHISAGKWYPVSLKFFYLLHHLYLVIVAAGIFISPLMGLSAFMIKVNLDAALAVKGGSMFREQFTVPRFFISQIYEFGYSLFIAPLGHIGKFEWKGTTRK